MRIRQEYLPKSYQADRDDYFFGKGINYPHLTNPYSFFDAMEARSAIKGFRYKIFSGTPVEFWKPRMVTEGY